VIDGLTVEYFWEYTVVVNPAEETETTEPEVPALPTTPEEIVDLAYGLAEGETTEVSYTLTGVITSIDTAWSDRYGNITVTIQIGDMADKLIKCYRLAGEGAATLKVGDTITVTGVFTNYKGTIEFAQGCTLDAVVPGPEVEPEEPAADAIVLDFSDLTHRTEFSTEKQEFVVDGLTLTNDKGESTSNVADYINPARFYKNSTLTLTCTGMTKIEFACNAAKYATALKDAIAGDNLTVEANGNTIVVTFTAPVDSFTMQLTGGQVRLNSVSVYVA
jgi:Ni,Fe-hydrogenase III small subunit